MSLTQEKALLHLAGKANLGEVSVDHLQNLVAAHPYFGPAHFMLTTKLQKHQHELTASQITKTALYFTNPAWLQYLLDDHWQLAERDHAASTPEQPQPAPMTVAQLLAEPEPLAAEDIDNTDPDDTEPVPDETAPPEFEPDNAPADEKISNILSGQLADFKKPVAEDAELDLDLEQKKLHTIDYFASLGIKVDLNAMPQDKLTSQLRKFTDWLKQMKQANQSDASDLGTSSDLENTVMMIAETSNESKEVVTETMAEVLCKQGQIDKAIQLYIKLSFINPEKSAYFAARIQQLKGI